MTHVSMRCYLFSLKRAPTTFFLFFLAVVSLGWTTNRAEAVTRSVFFTQSARNQTVEGISTAANSQCRLVISNPSAESQTYELKTNIQATGGTVGVGPSTLTEGTCSGSSGTFTCTGSLAANGSATYIFSYPAYTARPTVTVGDQVLLCAGSIVANDVGNPGFLIASGSLLTFSESGALQTVNTTGGITFFAGQAVFSQLPIIINGSKPF